MAVNTETSPLVQGLGNGNPSGVRMGNSSTDLIGFYGITTPIARRGNAYQAVVTPTATTVVNTAATTNTAAFGYTTTTQANAIVTQLNAAITDIALLKILANELRNALVAMNAIKGSA
jgi:hypothetical protein